MRQDLAKVICEDGRRGPRGDFGCQQAYDRRFRYRVDGDRREEYASLDALPSRQPMRGVHRYRRHFSENLGPLRGLIARSRGKHWDRVYGELCRLVSPTGSNLERHVHQHLRDFIHTQTRMGEYGVEYSAREGGWLPIDVGYRWRRVDYFVHPVSRCVQRIKRRSVQEQRVQGTLLPGEDASTRYARLGGIWFQLRLEPALYRTTKANGAVTSELIRSDLGAEAVAVACRARGVKGLRWYGAFENERRRRHLAYGDDLVAVAKRALGRKELRRRGLVNEQPQLV
jgi:hypothetical protein